MACQYTPPPDMVPPNGNFHPEAATVPTEAITSTKPDPRQLSLSQLHIIEIIPLPLSLPNEAPTVVTAAAVPEVVAKTPVAKAAASSKHTPVRPKGAIAIDNGTIDRTPAQFGLEDESKLHLRWPIVVPDKMRSGQYVAGPDAEYEYEHEVDWSSKNSVRKLNAWREQNLRRNFGEGRKTRENYSKLSCSRV